MLTRLNLCIDDRDTLHYITSTGGAYARVHAQGKSSLTSQYPVQATPEQEWITYGAAALQAAWSVPPSPAQGVIELRASREAPQTIAEAASSRRMEHSRVNCGGVMELQAC